MIDTLINSVMRRTVAQWSASADPVLVLGLRGHWFKTHQRHLVLCSWATDTLSSQLIERVHLVTDENMYSKTCVKRSLKNRQNNDLND